MKRCQEEKVSGTFSDTFSGSSSFPQGGLQAELRCGIPHPTLGTLRPASFDRVADILNLFLRLRLVEHHVPMIRHQAVSQNAHRNEIQALCHEVEKILLVILE